MRRMAPAAETAVPLGEKVGRLDGRSRGEVQVGRHVLRQELCDVGEQTASTVSLSTGVTQH